MSRRDLIRMTDEECRDFLATQEVLVLSTIGPGGYPHSMPLSYVVLDDRMWCWTYAKSQKARNLERDPRAAALVETGRDYAELRGAMLRVDVALHRDHDTIERVAVGLVERAAAGGTSGPDLELFRSQIPRRVALELVERSRVTWDHRKLGGVY